MALSNYQYTKGKHWYFKNAGKKEMGLSVCSEFSDISSHMMPAKIPIIVLILKRGPCLSCCGGRASLSIQYVQYMLFDGRSHLFLIFLPQNVPVTCVKKRQISSMLYYSHNNQMPVKMDT